MKFKARLGGDRRNVRKHLTKMLKRTLIVCGICGILWSPLAAWALDGNETWRDLSPKEREHIQRNYRRWQNLSPRDKEHLRDEWDRWQNLPRNRRDQLKRRYEDLHRRNSDD